MNFVYIVLINYNSWEHTTECVESIFRNSINSFKIVIVDNNSNIGLEYEEKFCNRFLYKIKKIKAERGIINDFEIKNYKIVLIKNNVNKGFAAGCNCAFNFIRKQNDFNYVWLLGCDNVIEKDTLVNLINYMDNSKDVELCASISLSYYQRNIVQCAGFGIYSKWTSISKHLLIGKSVKDIAKVNFNKLIKQKYLYVYGNSMFFRKNLFLSLLDISEDYFIYYEELDIMEQLKTLNMKFGIATNSFLYHKEGSSTGGIGKIKSKMADYYSIRNRILFTKKYYKYCLPTVYLGLIVAIFNRIKRKQFERIPMIIRLMFNPYPKLNEVK